MKGALQRFILESPELRPRALEIIRKFEIGSYIRRLSLGAVDRPHYGYCVYQSALLAKNLGHQKISILEFGVAGGNGLINLEYHAQEVSRLLGIHIEIFGFDTGEGLPRPVDYRDLPYHWKEGFFAMDIPKLKSRLKTARLVLGNVEQTTKGFLESYNPPPIAAIMYDLDFYSSTAIALKMFEANQRHFLPRVFCYFDDILGTGAEWYNDYTGQRLAIKEFNEAHDKIKLGEIYHFLGSKFPEMWHHQIRICHLFEHQQYNHFIETDDDQQLKLR